MLIARRALMAAAAALGAPGRAAHAAVEAEIDLAYGAGERRRVDVYRPRPGAARPPIVIVLPGGAWVTGSKENYGDVGRWLARHGCVAAVASYRLYPEVSYPAFVEDAAAVVAWARASAARWDADPERLYFLGHSAGAQIAALVALDPDFLAAHDLAPSALAGVVGVSGPYDLALKRIGWIDERIADWALMRSARPIGRVRSGAPPMLLIAGGLDPLVPPREAIEFAAALRGAGNRAEVRVVPALGHITVLYGMTWGPATDGIGAEVLRFVSA